MKLVKLILIIFLSFMTICHSHEDSEFLLWKKEFKSLALSNNISEKTFDLVMSNVKFLPDVIKYDRFQPEYYEDTKTYINKRTSKKKFQKV